MAYAALVSLAQIIEQILQHHDESSVFLIEKHQIRSLHDHAVFLQSFLEEFTEKLADNLEGRIRDITNEAEDIIEYFILNQIRSFYCHRRIKGLGNVKCFSFISEQVWSFYSRRRRAGLGNVQNPYHQYDIKKLYKKLQKVTHELDSIVGEVTTIKYSLRTGDVKLISDSPTASSILRQVCAPTNKEAMVGFDKDLIAIKARLCGQSSKLQVIPIFGMGGIGKTTLARNAYDDQLTMEHFHVRAWATVSQDHSVKRILSELLLTMETLNEERFDKSNETMETRVYKSLKGKRYIIVMDDMWSTIVWDDVRRVFPDDNNGSRIMLTTRLSDVAAYADCSSPLHEMRFMNIDQSWSLLRQKVFEDEYFPPELEDIGRMIARSCRGLPLAIVVIAGVLSKVSQTRASWENVAENITLAIATNEEQFANLLSLSYIHLPHYLRLCFLYMGGFPEDYEIHISKLIKLWTAECFIKPSGSKSYEESAEEYLEDLVKRSLILVTKRKSNGKIKSCKMHDLVRDLCIRKAQEEKFLGTGLFRHVNETPTYDQRRVSIHNPVLFSKLGYYDSTIRTILRFPLYEETLNCLKEFRLLRVLDVVDVKLISKKFPTEVLELFFLRYLAFSFMCETEFEIPASISRLRNLETLVICPYTNYYERIGIRVRLPLEIWTMKQLRHLVLLSLDTLPDPCPRYTALENLQTLVQVSNFKCTKDVLQMIPNLKKLGIVYQRYGIEWCEYNLNNLVHLHQLEKLSIRVSHSLTNPLALWGNLAFPLKLRKLKLKGFVLCPQDMMVVGSLPHLEVLKLECCSFEDCKWETEEEEFPRLKFLQIIETNLQLWVTETSHFPRLQRLMLCCRNLGEIPNDFGEIPTLELIEVNKWDKSLVESAKRIKEEQHSLGNDSLQVRVVNFFNTFRFPIEWVRKARETNKLYQRFMARCQRGDRL